MPVKTHRKIAGRPLWQSGRNVLTFPLLLIVTIMYADKNGGESLTETEYLVAQWHLHSFKKWGTARVLGELS